MRPLMRKSIDARVWCVGIGLMFFSGANLSAQDTNPQGQIYLPPAFGGTPLSFQIEAEAKYVASQGAFLESAAIARKINAEAVAQEIQNSEAYVKTYFEIKDINRDWREKHEWKTYIQILESQQKMMEQKIDKYYKETLRGDVTKALNWLLMDLYVVQYMSPGDLKSINSPLSKKDLDQIYLTDGGHGGNKLVIPAGSGEVLKAAWPYALQSKQFDDDRKEFEDARDAVLKEIQADGHATDESVNRLWKAVNSLMLALERAYPSAKRKDANVFLEYNGAKIFLKSLIVQVNRALRTHDKEVFAGSLGFKGDTLIELIQHMSKSGLMFARPQAGGERVYNNLFMQMRNLKLTLSSGQNLGAKLPYDSGNN
ncbi:MAG: hypothetical protein ACWGMZ_01070 [Thermoguttaceae bacterium]